MKLLIFLTAVALVPASAQLGTKPQSSVASKLSNGVVTPEKSQALQPIAAIEKEMDGRLAATGIANNDACFVLGNTRGLYISGFGAVFTAEVDLVNSPPISPFNTSISPELKVSTHKRKLAHVTMLEQTMRDTILSISASPVLKLTDSDQIVISVRLMYRPWEDMTGLPGQIVMRLDRRGGAVKVDVL